MTSFCKTAIPAEISEQLEKIKDNDEAVKAYGIQLGTDMCRRLMEFGTPGLHMYTLNLESAAVAILENLGLINKSQVCPIGVRNDPQANHVHELVLVLVAREGIGLQGYSLILIAW